MCYNVFVMDYRVGLVIIFFVVFFILFIFLFFFFFFFSSRRRHTRLTCDWSSDVCSSDLSTALPSGDGGAVEHLAVVEEILVHEPRGDRHVLLLAARVGEAQVGEFRLPFFYELQYVTGCHIASGEGVELAA